MLIQGVNRNDPEKVFISVYNVDGTTIGKGRPVSLKPTAASMDGVNAVTADAAADYPGFAGVAVKDIPANDYGLVQITGYISSVLLSNVGTSITINAGDPLVPAPGGFFSSAPDYAKSGFKFVTAIDVPVAVSGAAYVTGLIKML